MTAAPEANGSFGEGVLVTTENRDVTLVVSGAAIGGGVVSITYGSGSCVHHIENPDGTPPHLKVFPAGGKLS